MFRIPKLAMPRTRTVTTICNDKKSQGRLRRSEGFLSQADDDYMG